MDGPATMTKDKERLFDEVNTYKGAIKEYEWRTDSKVKETKKKGKHRYVTFKDGHTVHFIYSVEPLKDLGGTLNLQDYQGKDGISIEIGAFNQSKMDEDVDIIAHVLKNGKVYLTNHDHWTEWLNTHGQAVVWNVDKTGEKVISLPVTKAYNDIKPEELINNYESKDDEDNEIRRTQENGQKQLT